MNSHPLVVDWIVSANHLKLLIEFHKLTLLMNNIQLTRMHSSRMRTARSLTASRSICSGGMHAWGACMPEGAYIPGMACVPGGMCAWGHVCLVGVGGQGVVCMGYTRPGQNS